MKILITGATGSLGGALVRWFSNKGYEVIATGRAKQAPKKLLEYASYIQADITNEIDFPDADVCIHAAALSDDKAAADDLYLANYIGTKNVLKAVSKYPIFIHVSSSSVYVPSESIINENNAGASKKYDLSPYGKSKLQSEEAITKYCKNKSCYILRARAFYGIGDKMILPRLFKLVKNDKISCPGKMEIAVSMTHYYNFAHAIDLCIKKADAGQHVYNVADEKSYLLIDVLRKFTTKFYGKILTEKQIPISLLKLMALFKIGGITPLLIRAFTKDMILDISKIKKELGYSAIINMDESLDELNTWVQKIGGIEVLKSANNKLAWEI